MSKEIKIGLIGAGWMGKAHTTAFHNARMIFGDDMPVFELVSDVSEDAVAQPLYHQLDGRCHQSRNRPG